MPRRQAGHSKASWPERRCNSARRSASPLRRRRRCSTACPIRTRTRDYLARFTAPEFTTPVPDHRPAGLRPSGDRLRAGAMPGRIEVAQALPRQLPQPRRLPRGLHRRHRQAARARCSSRNGCASAATGIRAAACRSTCSGRPANCRRASGCRTRASRPIAGAARFSGYVRRRAAAASARRSSRRRPDTAAPNNRPA